VTEKLAVRVAFVAAPFTGAILLLNWRSRARDKERIKFEGKRKFKGKGWRP
jgi:hypothetical protein